jgi:hypothetical protein
MDMSVCTCGVVAEPVLYTRSAISIDVSACLAGGTPRLAGHVPACHRPVCEVPSCGAKMRTERYLMDSLPRILTVTLEWKGVAAAGDPVDANATVVTCPEHAAEAAPSSLQSTDMPVAPSSLGMAGGRMADPALVDRATGAPTPPNMTPGGAPAAAAIGVGAGREPDSPAPAAVVAMMQHIPLNLQLNDVFKNVASDVSAPLRGMLCAADTKQCGIFLDENRRTWRVRAGTAEPL